MDEFRRGVLRAVADLDARSIPWPSYRKTIDAVLGSNPTANDVYALGGSLKKVFKSDPRGRGQGELSRGGASWEILVSWYLNLLFWGTDAVVVRPRAGLVPKVIGDALSVRVKGVPTTKETDLVAFSVPSGPHLSGSTVADMDAAIRANPQECRLGVIQCKTNWNDNAQIPMLWNVIYSAKNLQVPNVTVGVNGFSPTSFGAFSYAFVTVPTNTEKNGKDQFKATTTAVVRVSGLSGGNYWGNPSTVNIADQISEYCGRNFSPVFAGGVQHHLAKNVLADPAILKMFLDFDF